MLKLSIYYNTTNEQYVLPNLKPRGWISPIWRSSQNCIAEIYHEQASDKPKLRDSLQDKHSLKYWHDLLKTKQSLHIEIKEYRKYCMSDSISSPSPKQKHHNDIIREKMWFIEDNVIIKKYEGPVN